MRRSSRTIPGCLSSECTRRALVAIRGASSDGDRRFDTASGGSVICCFGAGTRAIVWMRVDTAQKLFLGFKLDTDMRRQYADGKLAHRPAFKNGDPARLDILDVKGDLFIGRVVEGGL